LSHISRFIRLDLVNPKLGGTIGCVTDITPRKRHEDLQIERLAAERQRREEAEEERRQQELLIDVTSCVLSGRLNKRTRGLIITLRLQSRA
jgi:hypothetical protein